MEKPIETQVAEWSATEAAIRETVAKTDGITVAGYIDEKGAANPKKGREAVQKALTSLVTVRTDIEKRRKELKAPILALGTLVDSEAKRLTAISAGREAELQADRDAYDAEQAKIAAEAKAEADRLAAIEAEKVRAALQARVDRIASIGGVPNLAQIQLMSDEAFDALVSEVTAEQAAKAAREAQEKAEREEAERVAREQREAEEAAARAKADAEAAERRAAEEKAAAERKRLQDIEDARIAKEREDLARERAAQEAEHKRLQAESDRIEAERKAEADRQIAEREAEEKRIRDERARLDAEERAAAEAARIEAEKPDRAKIATFATAWRKAMPGIPAIASDALRANLNQTIEDVEHLLNLLAGAEGGEG